MQKNIKKILILIMLTNSTNQILAGDAAQTAIIVFLGAAAQVERAARNAFFDKLEIAKPGTIGKKPGHKYPKARHETVDRGYDCHFASARQSNNFSRHGKGSKS